MLKTIACFMFLFGIFSSFFNHIARYALSRKTIIFSKINSLIFRKAIYRNPLKHKNHKRQAGALCLWSAVSSPHSQLSIFNSQLINNFRIRSIYHVVFDALEIYLRRGLGTMSHACTDDRDGDVMFSRRCSPAVTRRVGT